MPVFQEGWALCDGTNSTPNLTDKFIRSVASAAENPGATGGTLQHLHGVGTLINGAVTAGTPAGTIDDHTTAEVQSGAGTTVVTGPITHAFAGTALGTHNHTVSGSTALNASADALPPYYKLAYIMRTAY